MEDSNLKSVNNGKTAVLITGPTAVGKTNFALRLAEQLATEIISVDSVLTYKYFNIGSAKPSASEMLRCKHHCVDIFEPNQKNTVAEWLEYTNKAYLELISSDKTPIFVGGTTMYITALLSGLTRLPSANKDLREQLEKQSSDELYQALKNRNPERASQLHPNDRLRIIRALEVLEYDQIATQHNFLELAKPIRNILVIVLNMPRQDLYARINQRSQKMVDAGLIEETRGLYDKFPNAQGLKSLGYSQCLDFIEGRISREVLVSAIAQATRNYAKRQITYFRNEPNKNSWDVNRFISEYPLITCSTKDDMKFYNFKESAKLSEVDLESDIARVVCENRICKPHFWYVCL